jgi:hypothetical protein
VSECDREASKMCRPWSTGGCCAIERRIDLVALTVRLSLNLILGVTNYTLDREDRVS